MSNPTCCSLNDGTGQRFLDVSALSGADDVLESKGVAVADYDGDGAMDMFVVNQAGSPRLYRNVTPRAGRHWLLVDLTGSESNRDGCGARVTATIADAKMTRTVSCGSGGTGSSHQRQVHFGLGSAASVDELEVLWPSGERQVVDDIAADQMVSIDERE